MLNRCQNSTSEVVAHYSLNVGSGDVELNVPDVLKVRRVCHSPVRQQSGGEGMELGGGGLLRGNPQPVLPLVLHIIQEVESVRRREPARGNKQKTQTTDCDSTQHQNTQPADTQNMQAQNDMQCQVMGYSRFILPQWNRLSQRRVQSKQVRPQ